MRSKHSLLTTLNHYDAVLLLGYAGLLSLAVTGLSHYPVMLLCGLGFLASLRLFQTPINTAPALTVARAFISLYALALLIAFFRAEELSSGFLLLTSLGAFPAAYWLARYHRVQASLDRLDYLYPAGLMILALWGLWDWWQTGGAQGVLNYRPRGPLTDHNTYAALLGVGAFLTLGVWHTLSSLKKKAAMASLFLAGTVFVLAQSRGAFLAVSATLVLGALLVSRTKPARVRILWTGGAATLAVLLGGLLLLAAPGMSDRMLEISNSGPHNALESRWMLVESSREMYLEGNRWGGNGLGHWRSEYSRFRHEYLSLGNNPHNDYLLLLVDTGPLGALALLGVGLVLLRTLWRYSLKSPPNVNPQVLGIGLSLMLLFGYAGLNFVFPITAVAVLVGFLLARFEYFLREEPHAAATSFSSGPRFIFPGVLLACVSLSIPLVIGEMASKALISQQFKEAKLLNETTAEQLCRSTADLLPGYSLPLAGLGYLYQRKATHLAFELGAGTSEHVAAAAESYGWFLRAHRAKPSRGYWGFQAGKTVLDNPELRALPGYAKFAEILIRDALYYQPTDEAMLAFYAEWLTRQARGDEALTVLDEGLRKQGDLNAKARLRELRDTLARAQPKIELSTPPDSQ